MSRSKLKNQKIYVLLKDLPGCPKGRLFKSTKYGSYYHYMTDEEAILNTLQSYTMSCHIVEDNPEWFSLIDKEKSK